MIFVTLLWSTAGVVTRQIEQTDGLVLTFWRSAFNALTLALFLAWRGGVVALGKGLVRADPAQWASGACWAVMFTAFMWALSLTSVANVLVVMALGPLFTALLARWLVGLPLTRSTLWAALASGMGLMLMQWPALAAALQERQLDEAAAALSPAGLGLLIALAVPLAAAFNWILIRWAAHRIRGNGQPSPDFMQSVLIGACLSAAVAFFGAPDLRVSAEDMAWLAVLGIFQLAVPCLLVVSAARILQPSEVALLSLMEVLFGVAWAWLWTAEEPKPVVVAGALIVVTALAGHEGLNWTRQRRRAGRLAGS